MCVCTYMCVCACDIVYCTLVLQERAEVNDRLNDLKRELESLSLESPSVAKQSMLELHIVERGQGEYSFDYLN